MHKMKQIPDHSCLDEYHTALVRMVAQTSWLPDPETVKAFRGAVFPTIRARKGDIRLGPVMADGKAVGMYDDNTTPRWAFLWSHGIPITHHPSGRTFAHVWEGADDMAAYTHLANILMVPEPFAALTDKKGPLAAFLRWHSWSVYQWKPQTAPEPEKPEGYDEVVWQYLASIEKPVDFTYDRLSGLNNGRSRTLLPIMRDLGLI